MEVLRTRERTKLLRSLKAGVVPNQGAHHLQVGRVQEVEAIINDLDALVDGATCFRVVVGDFGSGKTFLLCLTKEIAHQKNICVCSVDLSPERRLYSTSGHGRALYSELVRQLSTKQKPQGDALQAIIEKFILKSNLKGSLEEEFKFLSDFSMGFDFINVLKKYKEAFDTRDSEITLAALRWLRGEYLTKTDARQCLGVRNIIDDSNYYDALKVISLLIKRAGYKGMLIHIDEMVNILRISQSQTRKNNYEQILKMLNDMLQGNLSNIGIYFSGTPEFLTDQRRGLYTYEALRSRLEENEFAKGELFDPRHPVIRLRPLTAEDIYNLVVRVGDIYDQNEEVRVKSSKKLSNSYLNYCNERLGSKLFTSPRNIIRSYLNLRDILESNPNVNLSKLISESDIKPDLDPLLNATDLNDDDSDLSDFKLT